MAGRWQSITLEIITGIQDSYSVPLLVGRYFSRKFDFVVLIVTMLI